MVCHCHRWRLSLLHDTRRFILFFLFFRVMTQWSILYSLFFISTPQLLNSSQLKIKFSKAILWMLWVKDTGHFQGELFLELHGASWGWVGNTCSQMLPSGPPLQIFSSEEITASDYLAPVVESCIFHRGGRASMGVLEACLPDSPCAFPLVPQITIPFESWITHEQMAYGFLNHLPNFGLSK